MPRTFTSRLPWLAVLVAQVALAQGAKAPSFLAELAELRAAETASLKGNGDRLKVKYLDRQKANPADPMVPVAMAWMDLPSDGSWNAFKAIATMSPDNLWAKIGMGRVYTKWKMRDQAKAEFEGALKKDPNFFPAHLGLGFMWLAGGFSKEAEAEFRGVLKTVDDPEAHAGLGLVLVAQEKPDEAKVELKQAIALWPEQPAALQALLEIYIKANDAVAQLDIARKLVEVAPRNEKALRALADLTFESGNETGAVEEYEKLIRLGRPDVVVLRRMARVYKETNKGEQEERVLTSLAALDKDEPEPLVRLGELEGNRGAFEPAEKHLLEAVSRGPKKAGTHLMLAHVRLKKPDYAGALEALRDGAAGEGEGVEKAAAEAKELEKKIRLPAKAASGSIDAIYGQVGATLNAFYAARKRETPKLGSGAIKIRVKVSDAGAAKAVEVSEDQVGDPLLAAHAYWALKQAAFPKKKREPLFEFEFGKK